MPLSHMGLCVLYIYIYSSRLSLSHTHVTHMCIFCTCSIRTKIGEKCVDLRFGGSKITISGPRLRGLRFLYGLSALCTLCQCSGNLLYSIPFSYYNFGFSGNCTHKTSGRFYIYYNTRSDTRLIYYIRSTTHEDRVLAELLQLKHYNIMYNIHTYIDIYLQGEWDGGVDRISTRMVRFFYEKIKRVVKLSYNFIQNNSPSSLSIDIEIYPLCYILLMQRRFVLLLLCSSNNNNCINISARKYSQSA